MTTPKMCKDHQARLGCQGNNKFWYGYKRHVSVDMQSGLINKVAVTPANTSDSKALKHTCPTQGAVFGDKAYGINFSRKTLFRKGCHDFTLKMNHMKAKNRDKDRWLTACRSSDERVFSKSQNKQAIRVSLKTSFRCSCNRWLII